MNMENFKIGFIGAGTVGSALAIQMSKKGYIVAAVSSRRYTSAETMARQIPGCKAAANNQAMSDIADIVFITTPDDVIGKIAGEINWHAGQSVVHCSGADSTKILEPARQAGAHVGGFHPLQTFASVQRALDNMPGSTFTIEAEEPLLSVLKDMAVALDCRSIQLKPEDKVLYHTSAVLVSNYIVTLVKMATDIWERMGISKDASVKALVPLLKGTVANIETIGLPGCLTGPIARGDAGTIDKHLAALEQNDSDMLPVYVELALQTIPIAFAKGKITEKQAEKLISVLQGKFIKS